MEDQEYIKSILPALAKEMPYKWRVQSFSKVKPQATCVAYIDARDLMDRLDEVCTYGWDRDHKEIKNHLYAGIGIWLSSGKIQWRWDCGTESNQDKEKGESSDSFKRAGVNWGVGRFLYDLKIQYVDANKKKADGVWPHVVDANGNQVWDLTEFINNKRPAKTSARREGKSMTRDEFKKAVVVIKKAIGDDKYHEICTSYKVNQASELSTDKWQEFLSDMGKVHDKIKQSQSMRND
jgi:hypothetical protein